MDEQYPKNCTAFRGPRRLASGNLAQVIAKVKEAIDRPEGETVLIFDDTNGGFVDVDFRGTISDVLKRLEEAATKGEVVNGPRGRGPGRPRLGVVAREVTLLPRHWEWLNDQPGGASVALRKLVDEARRANGGQEKVRHAQDAAYRFMSAMAGDRPGFEEAIRALFAGSRQRLVSSVSSWPVDIREYTLKLSRDALQER